MYESNKTRIFSERLKDDIAFNKIDNLPSCTRDNGILPCQTTASLNTSHCKDVIEVATCGVPSIEHSGMAGRWGIWLILPSFYGIRPDHGRQ